MPSPEAQELALLLVRKAEGDESILDRLLSDHDIPDDVLGSHVQQAVEKRLKAVLALNEVEYEHTHSVSYLTALIEKEGIDLPGSREEIEGLTPWAVVARYDGTFEKVLDRAAARTLVSEVPDWSTHLVTARQLPPSPVEADRAHAQMAGRAASSARWPHAAARRRRQAPSRAHQPRARHREQGRARSPRRRALCGCHMDP